MTEYYEERFYRKKWWCRTTPDGVWYKFTEQQLYKKIEELTSKITSDNIEKNVSKRK